jgi:hypothetical protein
MITPGDGSVTEGDHDRLAGEILQLILDMQRRQPGAVGDAHRPLDRPGDQAAS